MRRLEITLAARVDLAALLQRSEDDFGVRARRRYEDLIHRALRELCFDPRRAGSQERPDLAPGIHAYHLRHSRRRGRRSEVGAPRHIAFYAFDAERVLVLRLLHDSMDFGRHLGGP